MLSYIANLSKGKTVLWCYLLWYLVNLTYYFDPAPRIWLNSVGISAIIGFALMLSVASTAATKVDHWQTFRLFAMPFCVSSFSSLIKGQGFLFVFPPQPLQLLACLAACAAFVLLVWTVKKWAHNPRDTLSNSATPKH
jgi:hypothetical protein